MSGAGVPLGGVTFHFEHELLTASAPYASAASAASVFVSFFSPANFDLELLLCSSARARRHEDNERVFPAFLPSTPLSTLPHFYAAAIPAANRLSRA